MSGDLFKCGHCGYEGVCYGVPYSHGVSAPFCHSCGKNDKLDNLPGEQNPFLGNNSESHMSNDYLEKLLTSIREVITKKHQSVSQCARDLGLDRPDLSRFLNGKKGWGIKKVLDLLQKLNMTFEIRDVDDDGQSFMFEYREELSFERDPLYKEGDVLTLVNGDVGKVFTVIREEGVEDVFMVVNSENAYAFVRAVHVVSCN